MPNSYFQFKQFTIWQDKCAMKVTTDGCLFGAIVAKELSNDGKCDMLDVGTGTGVLSLMIAQQNQIASIDAIEIDSAAAQQASENITASPWADRIKILHGDILTYQPQKRYDIIISNPPFYEKQLTSPNSGRQQAHHSTGLTLLQLFQQVADLLQPDGKFFVMIPFYRMKETIAIAESNSLFLEKCWQVKQTPKHSFFRTILCFSGMQSVIPRSNELIIRSETNEYTKTFTELLCKYYLSF